MARINIDDFDQVQESDNADMADVTGGRGTGADTIHRIHGTNQPWSIATETVDLGYRSYNALTGTYLRYSRRR